MTTAEISEFILHQTHYEKSDWSRAFNQFTIACELDMINAISADIAFIMSSSMSSWLPSPLKCSPQQQNVRTLRLFIEREIEKFVEGNDANNAKSKVSKSNKASVPGVLYLKEKKTTESKETTLLAQGLKILNVLRYCVLHCCLIISLRLSRYNKTISEFGFCIIS